MTGGGSETPTTGDGAKPCLKISDCELPLECLMGVCQMNECPDGICENPDEMCFNGLCLAKRETGSRCLPVELEEKENFIGVHFWEACKTGLCAQVEFEKEFRCVDPCVSPIHGDPEIAECPSGFECAPHYRVIQAEGQFSGWCYPTSGDMFITIGQPCEVDGSDPPVDDVPGHCISGWCSEATNTCEWVCTEADMFCPYGLTCTIMENVNSFAGDCEP